jgi:hypothetical protein
VTPLVLQAHQLMDFANDANRRGTPEAKSAAPSGPTSSAQQVADAKAKVCAAFGKVLNATSINSARSGGDDPNNQLLVATAQRQVFVVGSACYWRTLAKEPATPADLAGAINRLADLYQVVTLDGLVDDYNNPARDAANATGETIQSLCK